MGRYFLYRVHPWSVAECLHADLPDTLLHPLRDIFLADRDPLWEDGVFLEPPLKRDLRFPRRWRTLRDDQLQKRIRVK